MKWIFYVIVFIYMFYRAVYGIKPKELNSLSVEEIKYGPDKHYYPAGIRKTISCKGANKNQKVEWVDPNGKIIKRVSKNRVFVQEHFVPTSTLRTRVPALVLVLTHATVDDSGLWECRSGDIKRNVSLCIIDPSKFVDTPTEVSVDKGRSITLSCQARGEPEPRLIWYRNGELITEDEESDKYRVMTKYNSQGFEGLLTISSLEAEDSGVYTCEAIQESPHDSSCANTESFNITLQVNYAPVFADANETEIVYQLENESVDVVCSASGFPTPTYTWFRDLGETLFEFPDERVNLQDGSKAVLTLPSNATISSRRYKCRATNQYGEAYKVFVIYKLESPTKPSEVKKSLILTRSIDKKRQRLSHQMRNRIQITGQVAHHDNVYLYVKWAEEMSFPVKAIEVQYLEKGSLPRRKIESLREGDWRKSKKVEIDLESAEDVEADSEGFYFTLSDLESDTEYWIRLRAINEAGESPWSEPALVKTVEQVETEEPEEEAKEESNEETSEDTDESAVPAGLAYSDATFYGVFFAGGIVVFAVACMFLMRLV
ncbi:PREDICTED: hemicentin-1-like isoform X1 [Papilio xuthus]|uniref:Hemicentin-1-like isoform X1 n=1 Tax=Papilio xuthus TaxID=66420 RepID=A0AAJ6ZNF4_PAPXU|nr:PREDICTED: hemicentin-1-like isoform X1 [Papilio xuthus]